MRRPSALYVSVIVCSAAAALLSFRGIYEPDLWWHLAQGREDFGGAIVRSNLFSFTFPDYRQHYTSWLFDVAAHLAWTGAGGLGIQILQAMLLAATFWGVVVASAAAGSAFAPADKSGAPARQARTIALAVLLLAFTVIEPRAIPRPHLVSFAALALASVLVTRAVETGTARPLWWAVPLVAIWSNAHLEAVFGVAFIALFAAGELVRPSALTRREARRALGIAAVSAAATLVTPYGWGLYRYVLENASVTRLLDIAELQPPYLPAYRAFYVYLGVLAVMLLSQPKRLALWEIVVAGAFAALGLRYLRLTPLLVLVTAPMLASRLALFAAHGLDRRAILVTALAAAAVISRIPVPTLVTTLRAGGDAVEPPAFFSSRAVAFARTNGLGGPLFNSQNLGGYLAWTMYPQVRVFQDSRLQGYPPEHFTRIRYLTRSQAEWDRLVAPVDWAMLSLARPIEMSGVGLFPQSAWATVFWDEAVEIVVRRTGAYSDLARSHEYLMLLPESNAAVLAPMLQTNQRERLLAEARRNVAENPRGVAALELLKTSGVVLRNP
jgi:hypothetical protein